MDEVVKWERIAFGQRLLNTSFTTNNEDGSCENKQLKLKDHRGKLWTCEKQLKSIEFRRQKKYSDNISWRWSQKIYK